MTEKNEPEVTSAIENRIYTIRGQKVMIDRDLADLYEVELRSLNQAVKRNIERFPEEFMFQLTDEEWSILRSHFVIAKNYKNIDLQSLIVTPKRDLSKVRFNPYAFTEHGILMLSNVLNSLKAIDVSIQIIKVFNSLRKYAFEQPPINAQITELRKLLMLHIENCDNKFTKHEKAIRHILQVLDNLTAKPPQTKQIGFTAG